jgi:hypothetical protein
MRKWKTTGHPLLCEALYPESDARECIGFGNNVITNGGEQMINLHKWQTVSITSKQMGQAILMMSLFYVLFIDVSAESALSNLRAVWSSRAC